MEHVKDVLEKHFSKKLADMGIQQDRPDLTSWKELIEYELLDSAKEKEEFKILATSVHSLIKQESEVLGDWKESYHWYVDKLVYSFFNRVFAVRILEELELLEESTFIPQSDLGNRSARMTKIQEKFPGKQSKEWYIYLLQDVFHEISRDINVLFDETDPSLRIWPEGDIIEQIIYELNALDSEIYKAEDCIGWFYHYYVVKFRKGHKTMSSQGQKSPKNSYYLSILNTVYTPRWMVRILLENSLGHWWLKKHPKSTILTESPYFINKVQNDLPNPVDKLEKLKILDPACGSGNFLVYAFKMLFQMYQEQYPDQSCTTLITTILKRNLFGIDINRRPSQLSGLALYIMAKRLLKEHASSELQSFKMPNVNIICCDIRTPPSKEKTLLLQEVPDYLKKFIKDIDDLFNNADQIGSLIDIRGLKKQYQALKTTKLDAFLKQNNKLEDKGANGIVSIIDNILYSQQEQNIGLQLFGRQTKNALTLANVLMNKYEIIVTNPPFGYPILENKSYLKNNYQFSYQDLISAFIDQSLRLINPNGYISMVADYSFLFRTKFEKFRKSILLKLSAIQLMINTGYGNLPDAGNIPLLFVLRKNKINDDFTGIFRQDFQNRKFHDEFIDEVEAYNHGKFPKNWKFITQKLFLSLPRSIIDFNIDNDKFFQLYEFFNKYPPLDISQVKEDYAKEFKNVHIARSFKAIDTGKNDVFIRYWFEVKPNLIRKVEKIDNIIDVPDENIRPYVPLSKGGGDIQYYLQNGFILPWNKKTIAIIKQYGGNLRSPQFLGKTDIFFPLQGARSRGRFNIAQYHTLLIVTSGLKIIDNTLDRFSLTSYLNSKICSFFGYLLGKGRNWEVGSISRLPIPVDFIKKYSYQLKKLAQESYDLRSYWDTGNQMSPIYAESYIDKIIANNVTINDLGTPKTGHPFCDTYNPCKNETVLEIEKIQLDTTKTTIKGLLNALEDRFELLTSRLVKIDDSINQILYQLINSKTQTALDDYYNTIVGKTTFYPERDIWLQDFLMANLISIVKDSRKGVSLLKSLKEDDHGLYEKFIDLLCQKFSRDINTIQPILKELEELLGKPLQHWIAENFFFYHCHRFGGRPIIWQFSSRSNSKRESAIDLFVDYHQINDSTLSLIRVDYVKPILKILERRKEMETLPIDEYYQIDETNDFLKAILTLEQGYDQIPTPNSLTGNQVRPGAGDDKTWAWVFTEVQKIIRDGYKPDHFKGVLVNLVPLCLNVPEGKQQELKKEWKYLCPKGTIKQVLKKIDALDQLRER